MPAVPEQITQLQAAIAAQEALRPTLGDAVVDLVIAALGRQLAELEAQARPAEPQRKMVTVLFADVSGFTAMTEAMDAEEVADLMNTLWQRLDRAIRDHGGHIDKHTGDAVMALWGAEQAREDDPEQAIRAALAMQDGTRDLFESRHSEPLQMRIGLNTGPALLGEVATTREFTAMGDTVNIASRIQHAAPVGGILIAHDTYRQVRGVFDVQTLAPVQVKGKKEPIPVYLVQQAKPRAFRMATRGVEGIETHMVGRAAELQSLQEAFGVVLESASPQLLTVVGDAGVGKSRLLYEFSNWLELLPERIALFRGRATPDTQTTPYGILRDMFALRFDIRETDRTADAMAKFRVGTGGILAPDQADIVGHLIGFDFASSQAVQNLLGNPSFGQLAIAYLTNFLRATAEEPAVLCLEDIHWADSSSLNLVEHIARTVSSARLLIVCLARPTLLEHRPSWGQGLPAARSRTVELRPLVPDEASALVGQILHKVAALPQGLVDTIVRGADGNPFYIEELIKMMLDEGVIVRGEAQWTVLPDYAQRLHVPPTLTGILQARLDSLGREEKVVLQRSSVIGRRFWDDAVAQLGEPAGPGSGRAAREDVWGPLQALQSKELVFRQRDSAFADADEYLFKHALLRDVTYETVLLRLRRVYHAQAAAWLEAHAGERLVEYLSLIAEHYALAGEKEKAANYSRRVGEEKYKVSAFREALAAFEHALALLEKDAPERAALLVRIGYVLCQLSDYPLARQRLEEALAEPWSDRQIEADALRGMGWSLMGQGRYDATGPYLQRALQIGREIGDQHGVADTLYHLGDVAYRQGDSPAAEQYAGDSLAVYRDLGDRQGMVDALRVLGYATMARGDLVKAEGHHGESLAISREIGDRRGAASALINLGETLRRQGRLREALSYYQESLPIELEVGNRRGEGIALLNQGHTYSALDEDAQAWAYFRQAIAVALVVGLGAVLAEAVVGIALLRAKAGQYAAAAELLGFARAHPAWNAEVDEAAQPALSILRREIPAGPLSALMERGRSQPQDAVIGKVMAAP